MPKYEVPVSYKLTRRINVHAKDPAEAKVEARKVVEAWQGPFALEVGPPQLARPNPVEPRR